MYDETHLWAIAITTIRAAISSAAASEEFLSEPLFSKRPFYAPAGRERRHKRQPPVCSTSKKWLMACSQRWPSPRFRLRKGAPQAFHTIVPRDCDSVLVFAG